MDQLDNSAEETGVSRADFMQKSTGWLGDVGQEMSAESLGLKCGKAAELQPLGGGVFIFLSGGLPGAEDQPGTLAQFGFDKLADQLPGFGIEGLKVIDGKHLRIAVTGRDDLGQDGFAQCFLGSLSEGGFLFPFLPEEPKRYAKSSLPSKLRPCSAHQSIKSSYSSGSG